MKSRFPAPSFLLFACIASVLVAAQSVTAQLQERIPALLMHPDLMVTEVRVTSSSEREANLAVEVKNIGTKESGPCKLVLADVGNFLKRETWRSQQADLPALAPGATGSISFHYYATVSLSGIYWPGMILAAVDPAAPGYPSGQVGERGGELNNVFAFTRAAQPFFPGMVWKHPYGLPRTDIPDLPDVVVTQVMITGGSQLVVTVKNVGKAASEPCIVALAHTRTFGGTEGWRIQMANLPGLAPGLTADRTFGLQGVQPAQPPWEGMFIAMVDPRAKGPQHIAADALGPKLSEGSGRLNNAFGFTYRLTTSTLPVTRKNPAAQ